MDADAGSEPASSTWRRPPRRRRRRDREIRKLARATQVQPVNVAIIGVQKAATSSLFRMLAEHPGIAGGSGKETRFFFDPKQDWDDPDYSTYARPVRDAEVRWAMDATPAYFFWPTAIERMHRYDPGMRLIVSVRDPIERAFSQWAMERERDPAVPDLAEALARYRDEPLPPLGQSRYPAAMLRRSSLFSRGLYGAQLERGLAWFPREQWLFLEFRQLLADPDEAMDQVTAFLDLPPFESYPDLKHQMQGATQHRGAAPTAEAVGRLAQRYAEDLPRFAALSGVDVSSWPTSRVVAGTMDPAELRDRLVDKLGLSG